MGSLLFRRKCLSRDVIFGEGESTVVDARIEEDGVVRLLFANVRNALAFLPSRKTNVGLAVASELFPTYCDTRKHIIESALHNPNLVVHTIGTIMSASRIEYSKGEFWMYKEAFTPSVWNLVCRLDKEKNDILQLFGCERLDYLDACKYRNEIDLSKNSLDVFRGYANSGPKGPLNLESRYICEDVPMGLCLMSSLGRAVGVATPTCDALVTIAGALLNRDFRKAGRTLENLGVGNVGRNDLLEYLVGRSQPIAFAAEREHCGCPSIVNPRIS
jgi:opine dehydrogenase